MPKTNVCYIAFHRRSTEFLRFVMFRISCFVLYVRLTNKSQVFLLCAEMKKKKYFCCDSYIIGHYNLSVRISAQLLTPLMLCALILYVSGGAYSLTSTPKDSFLRNFFMAVLLALRVFARNLLRESRRRNIFLYFSNPSNMYIRP